MTLTGTVKRLITNIMIHYVIALAGGLLLNGLIRFDTQAAFAAGLSLGAAVSAVKVISLERGIGKSLSMNSLSAGLYAFLQITLRNVLSAGVLIGAVLLRGVNVWGAAAGLLLLQSAAFVLKGDQRQKGA